MSTGEAERPDTADRFSVDGYFAVPSATAPATRRTLPPPPAPPAPSTAIRLWTRYARLRRWVPALAFVIIGVAMQPGGAPVLSWSSGNPLELAIVTGMGPTPTKAPSDKPLGVPRVPPFNPGPYAFTALQPRTDVPVAYDPCRVLPYVINTAYAPPGSEVLLLEAIEQMSEITGLQFVAEGTTGEPPTTLRPPIQADRYGDRWAPILIAWTSPAEVPELAGDVVGLGGSAPVATRDGPRVYANGIVLLDGPQLASFLTYPNGDAAVRGVILHELGHLLGLAHVDDPGQLMYWSGNLTSLQAGDLTGLSSLGVGPCVDLL